MKKFKLLSVFLCSMAVTLSSCVVANPVTTRSVSPTTSKTSGSGSTTQPQTVVLTNITVSDVVTSYEIASQFVKPVVTAHYSDKSSKNVTEKAKFSGFDLSKAGKQTVNVEYTENAVKKTVSYGIEVSIFGWEEGIASRMREALDDSVLPYIAGLWSIYYEPENYYVQIYSQSYSVAEICAVLETAGLTKEKAQVYSYPTTHGTVTLQVWTTQGYGIIDANYEREIGEYSFALGRGKHRTKEVILLPYQGGYIADTPGFSSLDLDLFKEDLAAFFPAFNHLYNKCYFTNCLHISENKCAVKDAINEGKISKKAYECYQKLLDEAIFKKERYNK